MATASFANANTFDIVDPQNLPEKDKEVLIQHLIFSSNIKRLWKCGDAILEGIFNRKRKKRRLLHDKLLRKIVRVVRRFAKYEVLRSCLEGVLFDEIEHLEEDGEFSIGEDPLTLTQIYFCTNAWDNAKYEKEIVFDIGDEITSMDYMKIMFFLNLIENVTDEINQYVKRSPSKWKYKAMKALLHVKQNHKNVVNLVLNPDGRLW